MGYTYRAKKDSRARHDLGRIAKSAAVTFGVMAAMVGYQANSGPAAGITSASTKTQLVASTHVVSQTKPSTAAAPSSNHAAPVVSSGPSGG
jgi:hypothetical protein